MIKLYENDYQGLLHYIQDKWTDRKIKGVIKLEASGSEHLHEALQQNPYDHMTPRRELRVTQVNDGYIECNPVSVLIQKGSQTATILIPHREYSFMFSEEFVLEQSFMDKLKRIPASYKKASGSKYSYEVRFRESIEVTDTINLAAFIGEFKKFDEWLLQKTSEIMARDIEKIYNGDCRLSATRFYEKYLTVKPENKTFSIELK